VLFCHLFLLLLFLLPSLNLGLSITKDMQCLNSWFCKVALLLIFQPIYQHQTKDTANQYSLLWSHLFSHQSVTPDSEGQLIELSRFINITCFFVVLKFRSSGNKTLTTYSKMQFFQIGLAWSLILLWTRKLVWKWPDFRHWSYVWNDGSRKEVSQFWNAAMNN